MKPRRPLAALSALAAITLAACAATTSGQGSLAAGSGSTGTKGPVTGTTEPAAPGGSVPTAHTPRQLADQLQAGAATIHTAHLTLAEKAGATVVTAVGDETLDNGRLTGLSLNENLGAEGRLSLIIVAGKTYAKLPAALSSSTKPWVLVTTTSTNPTIRALATGLGSTQTAGSLESYAQFARAAKNVQVKGMQTVDGTATTRYHVDVDPTRLPASNPSSAEAKVAGITDIPVDMYLDGKGRPIRVGEDFTVSGIRTVVNLTLSNYNLPVSIKAPPANEVAPG